jgi:predicted N-acetyltransferase YhbS
MIGLRALSLPSKEHESDVLPSSHGMTIRYLDCRRHADGVAERIWAAFWRHKGTPLSTIRVGLEASLQLESRVPFAVVAESGGRLCGNILVTDSDEPAKPDLRPWLAALWVDEAFRCQGIATGLIEQAARRTRILGVQRLYLVSRPALRDFHVRRGLKLLEEGAGKHRQMLYALELGAVPSRP